MSPLTPGDAEGICADDPNVRVQRDGHSVSRIADWIMYSVEAEYIDRVVAEYGPCECAVHRFKALSDGSLQQQRSAPSSQGRRLSRPPSAPRSKSTSPKTCRSCRAIPSTGQLSHRWASLWYVYRPAGLVHVFSHLRRSSSSTGHQKTRYGSSRTSCARSTQTTSICLTKNTTS